MDALAARRQLACAAADAAAEAPALAPGLAAGLWREHILPWTRACAVAHLGEP